jgi:aromatic ring-opening dioxygenase LigB subunit
MPLPLLVGAWLLGQAGWQGATRGEVIAEGASAAECADTGAGLVADVDRVGLLIMGDGAVGRTEQAPRPYDPRTETFDGEVVAALRAADPAALLQLDPMLAGELTVAGRAAWQILAGATGEAFVDADVLYEGAPLGVGYVVAVWERHG